MVNEPVVTTFAIADPLILPSKPAAITATFAGPPFVCPAKPMAISLKNFPIPHLFIISPNTMNKKIYVEETLTDVP